MLKLNLEPANVLNLQRPYSGQRFWRSQKIKMVWNKEHDLRQI